MVRCIPSRSVAFRFVRVVRHTSSPSASQRSVNTSIICGSGTFRGNRGGCTAVPRVVAAFAAPALHRGSKSTSMTSSTSIGMADDDDSSVVVVVVVVVDAEPHDNNHDDDDEPPPPAAAAAAPSAAALLVLAPEPPCFPHHSIRTSCHFRNPLFTKVSGDGRSSSLFTGDSALALAFVLAFAVAFSSAVAVAVADISGSAMVRSFRTWC